MGRRRCSRRFRPTPRRSPPPHPPPLQNSHSFPQSVVAPMLPTEMVVDILLRLPVKSLLRCKSVCKLWCSLISDPSFVKSHLTLSNSADRYAHRRVFCKMENIFKTCPVHVIFDDPISDLEVDYPFEHSHGDFSVVGSCNGLICMFNGNHTMVVWNPSTRKSHYLPTHEKKLGDRVYGFGYDKSTDDYKAVTVYYGPKNRNWDWHVISVMIYSLKTEKWKEIDAVPNGYIPLFQSNTFLNGAVHWIANKGVGPSSHSRIIISLDLAKETYGEVLQPAYDDGYDMLTVGALREWLCVACSYDVVFRMDIWVMKVYGVENSWTKLVSISCPPDPTWFFLPVRFTISHEGKFLLRHGSKLIVYDSKNGSSLEYSFEGKFQAWIYVESLVSPMPLTGLEDRFDLLREAAKPECLKIVAVSQQQSNSSDFQTLQLGMLNTQEQQLCHQSGAGNLLAPVDTLQLLQPHGAQNAQRIDPAARDPPVVQTSFLRSFKKGHTQETKFWKMEFLKVLNAAYDG